MIGEALKGQAMLGGGGDEGGSPDLNGFENYFNTVYSKGKIEKTLIKEKYEKVFDKVKILATFELNEDERQENLRIQTCLD